MPRERHKPSAVLASARANVFYLQQVRVCQDSDRVVYLAREGDFDRVFNIPEKNTSFVLLGKGSSITDAAARKLADSGVLVGFCGSGGSPLFSIMPPVFLEPVSEYRPTEYMQAWVRLWMDEGKRLDAARSLLHERINWTHELWKMLPGIDVPESLVEKFMARIASSKDVTQLLLSEAEWAKGVYAVLARHFELDLFGREEGKGSAKSKADRINGMIDHGNYIAYGYASVVLTTLGISYAFPLLHGKTRRGALVFDVADIFKDGMILPLAFDCGNKGESDQEFRDKLIDRCWEWHLLDKLFDIIKKFSSEQKT